MCSTNMVIIIWHLNMFVHALFFLIKRIKKPQTTAHLETHFSVFFVAKKASASLITIFPRLRHFCDRAVS